jgi:3-hydroxyisobutyrate dehydrogenase-like beta-hydroxyacid dehydrogenase
MMGAAYPVGFIGLGTMGEAMALTLVKAGTRLLVWNRTRAKAEILAAAGGGVAREAADVFAQSATVLLSRDRKRAVTKPTAPRFTGWVTSIDLDAADRAAARPSGCRDGRR